MQYKKLVGVFALAGMMAPGVASATNGYFSHGYGMKAEGMGGAATAMADDAFGGANNPAAMVFAGNRLDVGLDWFSPQRSAERSGGTAGLNGKADSGSTNFFIPEFGYNKMLSNRMSLGVTVYGNGGMNTDYSGGQIAAGSAGAGICGSFYAAAPGGAYNLLCGTGKLGVDLMQLIVAPTVAYKVNRNNSIGIAPLFGYQRFKAEGLQAFAGLSSNPSHLTNQGYDSSTGWGVRIGWMGKVSNTVTLGAAYASKIKMSKMDKYKGLFANQGEFDLPSNWNLGIAVKATPKVTIAADYQRINYSDVDAIANPSTNSGSLGSNNGRGFGWQDVDVVKLGVEYQYNRQLTLRAGYDHTDNPIQSRDVTFNILAPGVVQDHLTLGFTYGLSRTSELTMAYMHAFKNSVTGSSLFNKLGVAGSGNEKIQMYEDSLGIAYGMKF
ncbi:MAG TPA: long-chain fatty acid transporter [Betaproteobacteria bacterium]|nr:long-chain fatty acid transporter [Betaproteobacteria bacterium]